MGFRRSIVVAVAASLATGAALVPVRASGPSALDVRWLACTATGAFSTSLNGDSPPPPPLGPGSAQASGTGSCREPDGTYDGFSFISQYGTVDDAGGCTVFFVGGGPPSPYGWALSGINMEVTSIVKHQGVPTTQVRRWRGNATGPFPGSDITGTITGGLPAQTGSLQVTGASCSGPASFSMWLPVNALPA